MGSRSAVAMASTFISLMLDMEVPVMRKAASTCPPNMAEMVLGPLPKLVME